MEKAESLEGRMGNYDIGNAFLEKIRTLSNLPFKIPLWVSKKVQLPSSYGPYDREMEKG